MNPEVLTWGAIIMAGTSIVAMVKFWIDIGKAWERMDFGSSERVLLSAKMELLNNTITEFKIEVARTYATTRALTEAETSFAESLQTAVEGVYSRLDAMTSRLDNLLTLARDGH